VTFSVAAVIRVRFLYLSCSARVVREEIPP
jgi:hypothetical protein